MKSLSRVALGVGLAGSLLVAGCSGKAASDPSGSGDPNSWAAGSGAVKVGLIAPLTGPLAVVGVAQRNSLQVEIDRINKEGGVGGAHVELVSRDYGVDPAKAVQAANEFAGDNSVKLVVGPSFTSFYNAAKGAFEQNKKVNCQPGVGAGDFADLHYGFRAQERIDLTVDVILQYLKDKGVKSIGLIYENDDTGQFVNDQLKEKAGDYGIDYLGFQQSNEDDSSHVSYVQALSRAGALWISSAASGAKTMAAASEEDYPGILVGGSGLRNLSFVEAAGDAAEGTTFAATNYQFLIRDRSTWKPAYRQFEDAIAREYGVNVGPKSGARMPKGTPVAADCVFAWNNALSVAKTFDPDAVARAMEDLNLDSDETPSGSSIAPGKSHEFDSADDIYVYRWEHDSKGWYMQDVTPAR